MNHRHALLAITAAVFGSTALGGAWVGAGWSWDALNGVGFVTAALLAWLCVETSMRSRPSPHAAYRGRLHRNLGLVAAAGAGIHAIGMAIADPVTLEYWKPSAPLYMLAGIVAAIVLMVVVGTALTTPRRRLFPRQTVFRRAHRYGTLAAIGLAAWHVLGSGFYIDALGQQAAFLAAAIGAPLLALQWPLTRGGVDAVRVNADHETVRVALGACGVAVIFAAARQLG